MTTQQTAKAMETSIAPSQLEDSEAGMMAAQLRSLAANDRTTAETISTTTAVTITN